MGSGESKKKKPLRKIIVIASIALVIVVSFFVFYFIGQDKFAPENKVMAFEDAVKNGDAKELRSLLSPYKDTFKITDENTAELLAYLEKNPDAFEALIEKLNSQVEFMKSSSGSNGSKYLDDVYGTINITQKGKQWVLFNDYQLVVVPAYIEINANNENVDLLIDNEKMATSSGDDYKESFGPFMPGIHNVKAVFDNSYVSTEEKETIDLFNSKQQTVGHSFDLPLGEIEINSLFDDFDLYVNGEKADTKIKEGKQSIGTFPIDGSVVLDIRKAYPWGDVKSNEQVVEDNYIGFDTVNALSDEAEIALMEKINDTINQRYVALTKKDASIFKEGITDNMKKDFKDSLKKVKSESPKYKGKLVKARYDLSKISNPAFNEKLDGYSMTLRAHFTFHEPNDNLGWLLKDDDKNEYTRSKEVTVVYDEDAEEWKVDKYETEYFIVGTRDEKVFEYDKK